MATAEAQTHACESGAKTESGERSFAPIVGPSGWKRRLEDPFNIHYRYPVALWLTKKLLRTRITPNQISGMQPLFAAGAGYLLTLNDYRAHVAAVALFEFRSILDCVDGSLARARRTASPNGHAIDALCDWLGVVLLYLGIFGHIYKFGPQGFGADWFTTASALGVVFIAMMQGATRSFSFDYFKSKYLGIFEKGKDELTENLHQKLLGVERDPNASFFARADVVIMRCGRLSFEGDWYNASTSRPLSTQTIAQMADEQDSPRTKSIGFWWAISNGDAFLSFVMLSILAGQIWAGQLFFATLGLGWIVVVLMKNTSFIKSYTQLDVPTSARASHIQ
jgi:phosphatidylglycerophosphate synthase